MNAPLTHALLAGLLSLCACSVAQRAPDLEAGKSPAGAPRTPRGALTWLQHELPPGVSLRAERNGRIVPRTRALHLESPWAPRLLQLRAEEGLDEIVGTGDEWTRMQRLARWVYDQWAPSTPLQIPPWDALDVLDSVRAGGGGWCAQFAIVQVQAAVSLGWQARYLSLETADPPNGHVGVEMWSNRFDKWVVLDPHFGLFAEAAARPGLPLSALEIHTALVEGRRDGLIVRSLGGNEIAHPRPVADFLGYFFHLAADQRNDHLSGSPHGWSRRTTYLAWRDAHSDGRPGVFDQLTEQAADFAPPLNQVELTFASLGRAHGAPGRLLCAVRTNMTGVGGLKLRLDDEPARLLPLRPDSWELASKPGEGHALSAGDPPARSIDMQLGQLLLWSWDLQPGRNTLALQAVGALGVEGPPAEFEVWYEP